MTALALASISYNHPRVISEQIRLLDKYLEDDFSLAVFDASSKELAAREIEQVCAAGGVRYRKLSTHVHHEALNQAASLLEETEYLGFLDHDVFPVKPTRLIPLIEEAGFYGIGQRHPATGHLYLWPGFCFFSREWLNGRSLDFSGIRDGDKRNDGDTGSALWPLFAKEDWAKLFRPTHQHRFIREPDGYGLQSFGYEQFGDWLHFTNASHWMKVPRPKERDKLLFDLLASV